MNALLSPRLVGYFDDYSSYHHNGLNKLTHYIGIPILTIAIPALLAKVVLWSATEPFRLDLGIILWLLATCWYLYLSPVLGFIFSALCLVAYYFCRDLPALWLWSAFAIGWILQFLGHIAFERRSPAFFKNFEHLLIGPFWVFASLLGLIGKGNAKTMEPTHR